MDKRTFIKSSLGLAGLSLINPLNPVETFGAAPPFELPKLPFAYGDLEPKIDARTVELHYSKHHAAYVEKLNEEVSKGSFQYSSLEDLLAKYAHQNKVIRNHGGGHWNHSFMWKLMAKPGKFKMSNDLKIDLITAFDSMEGFLVQMTMAGLERFGSGWVWLCKGTNGKLFVTSTPNQDNPLMKIEGIQNGKPLLGMDVWEHAYYLKYYNKRLDFMHAYLDCINWMEVERLMNEK